jgi:hypothetical protein
MATKKVIVAGTTIDVPTPKKKTSTATKVKQSVSKAAGTVAQSVEEVNVAREMPKPAKVDNNVQVNVAPVISAPTTFNPIEWYQQYSNAAVNAMPTLAEVGERVSGTPTTGKDIAKASLKAIGIPESIANSALDFYEFLLKDGISNPKEQSEIFFYNENYTNKSGAKIPSPFYNAYGKFRDIAGPDYTEPRNIVAYVDGIKNVINKNGFNPKFANDENIEKYIRNSVDVAELSRRANDAIAASITTDAQYVESLKQQGFINGAEDLKDFYMDPAIGEETLQQRKISGVIGAEAIRRKTPQTPTLETLSKESKAVIQQAAARYRSLGYTEAEARSQAEKAYDEVAASLEQTTKLSGIYEGRLPEQKDLTEAGRVGQVQTELEKENLLGLASARRKKVNLMNIGSFSGSSGTSGSASFGRQIQI